jgi:hypothetical protein
MTNETTPRLKRPTTTPDQPSTAEPADSTTGRSAPEVVARQGVQSARRPDPHPAAGPDDTQVVVARLHVIAPRYRTDQPKARSWCACGRDETAVGIRPVQALVTAHTAHREHCPLHNPHERRTAA